MVGFRLAHWLTRYSLIVNGPPSTHELLLKAGCRSYCTTSWNSIRNLFPLKSISGPLACTPRTSYTHLLQYPFAQRHEQFCTTAGNEEKQKISVTFVDKDGEEQRIKVPVGMSMLEAAHENDIELEGACEASLACSTCHVIVMVTVIRICCLFFITKKFSMMHSSKLSRKWDAEYYNKLDDPTDDENDMLDLAFGLCNTSRLGCQVIAKPELDGIQLALPGATRNFAVDGYKPKSH